MKTYKEIQRIDTQVTSITCNMCGKVTPEPSIYESFSVYHYWGYGSRKDGEAHVWDLCEDCYDNLISKFKIKVDIRYNE